MFTINTNRVVDTIMRDLNPSGLIGRNITRQYSTYIADLTDLLAINTPIDTGLLISNWNLVSVSGYSYLVSDISPFLTRVANNAASGRRRRNTRRISGEVYRRVAESTIRSRIRRSLRAQGRDIVSYVDDVFLDNSTHYAEIVEDRQGYIDRSINAFDALPDLYSESDVS